MDIILPDFVYIPEMSIDDESPRARILAFWAGGDFAPNFEYELEGTPCGVIYEQGMQIYPRGVQQKFPNDLDLV